MSIIILFVIIDFHTHVVTPHVKEKRVDYISRDNCFSLLYSSSKAKLVTAEETLTAMDEYEIDKSVILNLGWQSHELCRETNDYILDSLAKHSKRLIGFCTIQPLAGDKALREIERCAQNGAKGIGEMRPDVQKFDLNDTEIMKQLINLIISYDLIFLIHASEPVGHHYIGKGKITPDILYEFIVDFPQLKMVCAHWGGGLPFYALMPEVEKAFTNIYFDTAATPFLYKPNIFRHVTDILGSDRILFGSDFPLLSPRRIIDQAESTDLNKEDKLKIFGGNAKKLLSI